MYLSPCVDIALSVSIWYRQAAAWQTSTSGTRWKSRDKQCKSEWPICDWLTDRRWQKLSWPVCTAPKTKHLTVEHVMIHLTVLQAGPGGSHPLPFIGQQWPAYCGWSVAWLGALYDLFSVSRCDIRKHKNQGIYMRSIPMGGLKYPTTYICAHCTP